MSSKSSCDQRATYIERLRCIGPVGERDIQHAILAVFHLGGLLNVSVAFCEMIYELH